MSETMLLEVPLEWSELSHASTRLQAFLEQRGAPSKACFVALLVLEEVGTNILKYAYPEATATTGGKAPAFGFSLKLAIEGQLLHMVFVDYGQAFDPTATAELEQTSLEESAIGGRGLMLVQRMSSGMRYTRQEGRNLLEVDVDLSD